MEPLQTDCFKGKRKASKTHRFQGFVVAEKERFELSNGFTRYTISSRAPSTKLGDFSTPVNSRIITYYPVSVNCFFADFKKQSIPNVSATVEMDAEVPPGRNIKSASPSPDARTIYARMRCRSHPVLPFPMQKPIRPDHTVTHSPGGYNAPMRGTSLRKRNRAL